MTSSVMISMSRWRSCGFNTLIRILFETADLEQAADVARLPHRGGEPGVHDPDGGLTAGEQRGAEGHHVRAVVFARVPRDRLVGAHRCPDAMDLVRRDRGTDA